MPSLPTSGVPDRHEGEGEGAGEREDAEGGLQVSESCLLTALTGGCQGVRLQWQWQGQQVRGEEGEEGKTEYITHKKTFFDK